MSVSGVWSLLCHCCRKNVVEVASSGSWWLCWCGHDHLAFLTLEPSPFRNEENYVYFDWLHLNHILSFLFLFFFFSSSWKGVILSISWVSGSHDVDDHNLVRHNWIILSQSHLIPTKLDSSLSYTMCKTFFFQSSRVATAFRLAPFFPLEKAGNLEVWFPFSASMPYRLGLSVACWLFFVFFLPGKGELYLE